MVGSRHQLDAHEFEQAPGDGEVQGRACCSPWGRKESDTTEQLNRTELNPSHLDNHKSILYVCESASVS